MADDGLAVGVSPALHVRWLQPQLRREIFDARLKNYTNQLDDPASIRRARRNLARVKTLLQQKQTAR